MREQKTEAVILANTDVFDADRNYLLFTREFGKIRARAKGVRKTSSRLTGHLLSFLPTDVQLVAQGGFFLIVQAHIISGSGYPVDALSYLRTAEQLAETIDKLIVDQSPHPAVYDALVYTLDRLKDTQYPYLIAAEFFMKCLVTLGYTPELDRSVVTGEVLLPEHLVWSSEFGGVYNAESHQLPPGSLAIHHTQTVVALRQFVRPEFLAERISMNNDVRNEVIMIIQDYLQTTIGKPLKSMS